MRWRLTDITSMSSLPLSNSHAQLKNPDPLSPTSSTPPTSPNEPFNASRDARTVVRLIQCSQCSHPFRQPVTLPCGHTLCKGCLPQFHLRQNITYPASANRLQGFTCPFKKCGREHVSADCGVDVVVNKVMEIVRRELGSTPDHVLDETSSTIANEYPAGGGQDAYYTNRDLRGQLVATFLIAEAGQLPFDTDTLPAARSNHMQTSSITDDTVLERLKDAVRSELDCQLCYALFLDPLTFGCGHTLCRSCLHRVQDHYNACPTCRRQLNCPPGVSAERAPSNKLLEALASGFWPAALASRTAIFSSENMSGIGELDTPLFVCTLSFPETPILLHIFEPRYKLMMRRAMETGGRRFGMILHNPTRESQGELGRVQFYQYGTMLHIDDMHLLPDGRSILSTRGIHRFRILKHGFLDGYLIGKVERFDDMSVEEEEALEVAETSSPVPARTFSAQDHFGAPPHHVTEKEPVSQFQPQDLDSLSTADLMKICLKFVDKMKQSSASWLHRNIIATYGDCPSDPKFFPWWFASIVPLSDMEKYKILTTRSVRERLKMCVLLAMELERQRTYGTLGSHPIESADSNQQTEHKLQCLIASRCRTSYHALQHLGLEKIFK